jgi:hypothetical protein
MAPPAASRELRKAARDHEEAARLAAEDQAREDEERLRQEAETPCSARR